MKKVKIAILGLGNVGKGVWKILNMNKEEIVKRSGYEIEVSKILVRDKNKDRGVTIPKGVLTSDADEIFNDESIKIVVELMGGSTPAKEYMLKAIRSKKHVVTANKLVIANWGEELFSAAKEEKVLLQYEASVAGGIPIIHGINESLTANKINEVVGIINGTTNYILTKMTLEGMSFKEALKEAQEKGYAEADPTSDIEAYDAVYKLEIITSLSFGVKVKVENIYREGITNIRAVDIQYAKEFGYVIKLLAIAKEVDNEIELRVHPTMIPSTHPLANVNDSFNAILLKGNAVGDLMLYGRGAGELPTGSAVVGDIISILKNDMKVKCDACENYKYSEKKISSMEKTNSEYYVRVTVKDEPGILGEISTIFAENKVSILSVIQKGKRKDTVNLVFVTHKTKEGNVNKSLNKIKELKGVYKIENVIRIENVDK